MYSLEDGFKNILAMANEPFEALDMAFAAVLDKAAEVPSAIVEMMPNDMKKACVAVALGTLLATLQERISKK